MEKYKCICGSEIVNNNSAIKKHETTLKHLEYVHKQKQQIKKDKINNYLNEIKQIDSIDDNNVDKYKEQYKKLYDMIKDNDDFNLIIMDIQKMLIK